MRDARIVSAILGLCISGAFSAGLAQAPAAAAGAEELCSSCHEQGQKLKASAHAVVGCASCHPKHEEYPHPAGVPKPACGQCHSDVAGEQAHSVHGQALRKGNAAAPTCNVCHGEAHEIKTALSADFRQAVPETCGMCHSEIAEQFKASVHGKAVASGVTAAPVCTSCHGEHEILPPTSSASLVHRSRVPETCGQCHGNVRLSKKFGLPEDRLISFQESFHGLASKAGSQSVANCASCHGVHEILPSSDPKSMIHPRNLPQTCGRCHPGAGRRFALGPIHQHNGHGEPPAVQWARAFYLVLIPLLIGLMLLHNLGDFIRKLIDRRLRQQAAPPAEAAGAAKPALRMLPFERVQHAVLVVSFVVLVWTGFALKYPDQFWARPLVMWEPVWPVRGTIHRIASVVFIVLAFVHLASLIVSRQLRRHWMGLLPRRSDLAEALGTFGYNIGILSRRPVLSEHSYIEKAEYWAVVWGAVIMIATGTMLWANNLMLQWLPKWVIDLATAVHFYEAILAALAIVVWHFYSVIFDPDVYPMDTAWLTGYSVRRRRPAEDHGRAEMYGVASRIEEHDSVT